MARATDVVIALRDKTNQDYIIAAKISYVLGNETKSIITNYNGEATLANLTLPCKLHIHALGYEDRNYELELKSIVLRGEKNYVTIDLTRLSNTFNDVVVTAQAKPVLAAQSIYKINTVNSVQMMQRGAVTLNDVLNYELNNFISNDNVLGSSVSVAGIGGQNVKVLINGIPVLGRENGNIDLGQLNLNNIKRIEMIQGPMSVMYGSNALGGVINLITNQPQKNFSVTPRVYLESIGKYNLSTNVNYSKGNHSAQASFARNFFQGWTPKEDSADRFQLWKPKTQYTSDLQYSYQRKKWNLTYFSSLMHETITNKGLPIINPYEAYAFDEYYITRRMIQSLSNTIKFSEKTNLTLLNSYSVYNRTKNRFKKDLVSLEQFLTPGVGDQDTSIFNNVNLRGTLQSSLKNTQILVGYEYSFDNGRSYKLADNVQTISDLGLFGSVAYQKKNLSVQPSARYTFNNRFGKAFTPALHLKYDLNTRLQIRSSYARGFRAPSLKEMYLQFIDQNHTIIGNEDLKPEIGNHAEVNAEYKTSYAKNNIVISGTASINDIRNMITLAVYDGSGILRKYANLERYQNYLINTKARLSNRDYSIELGSGLIYVKNTGFIPQHSIYEFSSNFSYLIKPIKTNINFNYKLNSKQPILTVDEKYLFTQPIHIANMSFQRYIFSNALSVQIGVKNLFNLTTSTLSNSTDLQGGGHLSSAGLLLFPNRSLFMDVQYKFNQ
jgi:outer membrane receptor for ferrienterochelin and colicins